jgi:hypothetical protein
VRRDPTTAAEGDVTAELKRLRRENEINNPEHRGYYAMFGAQSGDFIINDVVTGETSPA